MKAQRQGEARFQERGKSGRSIKVKGNFRVKFGVLIWITDYIRGSVRVRLKISFRVTSDE